jgi:hypothetical protein
MMRNGSHQESRRWKMDKQRAIQISAEIEKILQAAQDSLLELGISVKVGRMTYRESTATLKLEIGEVRENGEATTKEAEAFRVYCYRYGLEPEDRGNEIIERGQRFRLEGINPKAKKFPFIARNLDDGKLYRFSSFMANAFRKARTQK